MNEPNSPEDALANASPEEIISALFANMVVQQTNMAMMLLGKVPHPESGQTIQDLEGAKMFIDQLEMLAVKTKGNLDKREQQLLQQSLTALRMSFVEMIEGPATGPAPAQPAPAAAAPPAEPVKPAPAPTQPGAPAAEEESRKKFSKKY